jgi:hypothetical protein
MNMNQTETKCQFNILLSPGLEESVKPLSSFKIEDEVGKAVEVRVSINDRHNREKGRGGQGMGERWWFGGG